MSHPADIQPNPDWSYRGTPVPDTKEPPHPVPIAVNARIDNLGFGAWRTSGGPVRRPIVKRRHTKALCSPDRTALITGPISCDDPRWAPMAILTAPSHGLG